MSRSFAARAIRAPKIALFPFRLFALLSRCLLTPGFWLLTPLLTSLNSIPTAPILAAENEAGFNRSRGRADL
jgi:hypothetical protein